MCYYVNEEKYTLLGESSSVNLGKAMAEAESHYDYWKDVIEFDIDNLHLDAIEKQYESESDVDEYGL